MIKPTPLVRHSDSGCGAPKRRKAPDPKLLDGVTPGHRAIHIASAARQVPSTEVFFRDLDNDTHAARR